MQDVDKDADEMPGLEESEDEREAAQFMREQERQKNEASALRLEAQKRATLAQELDTRAKAAKDRAMAEAEGRILQERKNHDLKMKELRAEGDLKMKTMLESIQSVKSSGHSSDVGAKQRDRLEVL